MIRMKDEIKQIRTTLKARIIPNLPLEPKYLRKNIEDIIDKFEFEWYFKETIKKVFEEIGRIKTIHNLIGVNATDLIEFNNKLRELKKRLLEVDEI